MMTETLSERSERIRLELVAEDYTSKGYHVLREPKLDFLQGFIPDLVVEKDGVTRVIEVKSRSSLLGNDRVVEMAKLVYSQPGWTFDLHMVGEPEAMETPKGAKSFNVEHILERLEDAEKIRDAGQVETAFLLAWTACEAALRELTAMYGFGNVSITTATHLIEQSTYHGVISRDDYFRFMDAVTFRNAFAHGYTVDDFDHEMLDDLIVSARCIANSISRGPLGKDEDEPDFWPPPRRNGESEGANFETT